MTIKYPYTRARQENKCIRIEVAADSMRVGKSTAVKVIGEGLRGQGLKVTESYEDWQHNPYLKESYSDPAKNFLDSQKWFVHRKWEQVRDGSRSGVFLQDVTPEMDFCYAVTSLHLGRMSQEHFDTYAKYYYSLDWAQAPAPDLLIYLELSDDELVRRAFGSRREFEIIEPEYLLMMKRVNREWRDGVQNHKSYEVVNIDTDLIDFANSPEGKRQLLEVVARIQYDSKGR